LLLALNSSATAFEIARAPIDANVDRASPAGFIFPRQLVGEVSPLRIQLNGSKDAPSAWHFATAHVDDTRRERFAA